MRHKCDATQPSTRATEAVLEPLIGRDREAPANSHTLMDSVSHARPGVQRVELSSKLLLYCIFSYWCGHMVTSRREIHVR